MQNTKFTSYAKSTIYVKKHRSVIKQPFTFTVNNAPTIIYPPYDHRRGEIIMLSYKKYTENVNIWKKSVLKSTQSSLKPSAQVIYVPVHIPVYVPTNELAPTLFC